MPITPVSLTPPPPAALVRTRVLLAEDEPVTRRLLEASLQKLGYEVVVVSDGAQAWSALSSPNAPSVALLDWNMPGLNGLEVCAKVRQRGGRYTWMLLLTTRATTQDLVTGLRAGADDFVTKPVDAEELAARLNVGERLVRLEHQLASRVEELEEQGSAARVALLEGMVPICMHCKRIRNEAQHWERVETFIEERSEAKFSHAICVECLDKHYPDL